MLEKYIFLNVFVVSQLQDIGQLLIDFKHGMNHNKDDKTFKYLMRNKYAVYTVHSIQLRQRVKSIIRIMFNLISFFLYILRNLFKSG